MRFLIDTDWAIHYLNKHAGIVERLQELQQQEVSASLSSPSQNSTREYFIHAIPTVMSAIYRIFSAA
jgi:hypothetical protein